MDDSVPAHPVAPLLRLEALGKQYRYGHERSVLADVELSLAAGEYIAIMGESGVGKSTQLNLIAGLDQPDCGRIILLGQALDRLDDNAATQLRRRAIGFVFQAFPLLPHLSVAQNIALPLLLNGKSGNDAAVAKATMLSTVGLEQRRQHGSGLAADAGRSGTAMSLPPLRRWHSPRTGIDYPVAMRVNAGSLQFELTGADRLSRAAGVLRNATALSYVSLTRRHRMQLLFEWDTVKALSNLRKLGVYFETAAKVFPDPLALTLSDTHHHEQEERWITLGQVNGNKLVVVVHTWRENETMVKVRIISARPATRREEQQYQGNV